MERNSFAIFSVLLSSLLLSATTLSGVIILAQGQTVSTGSSTAVAAKLQQVNPVHSTIATALPKSMITTLGIEPEHKNDWIADFRCQQALRRNTKTNDNKASSIKIAQIIFIGAGAVIPVILILVLVGVGLSIVTIK